MLPLPSKSLYFSPWTDALVHEVVGFVPVAGTAATSNWLQRNPSSRTTYSESISTSARGALFVSSGLGRAMPQSRSPVPVAEPNMMP